MAKKKNKQNIEINSKGNLTIDTRKSGGIDVDGNFKVNSQKDLAIIGDGKSSEEMDRNIMSVLKNREALKLYESNKKYLPTVIFTEDEYSAKASAGFVIKQGTVVSGGVIIIDVKELELKDSIIAAEKIIYFKNVTEVECDNSYIGAEVIYVNNSYVAEELMEECKVYGIVKLVGSEFNHDEL